MIKKHAAAALLLAAVPAGAGAAATQEGTAAAATGTHTLHLRLHVTAARDLDRQNFAGTERVRSRDTHQLVGFDSFTGQVRKDTVVFETAFALKGGVLLTRVHTLGKDSAKFAGRVTGGSGAFSGATGTMRGHSVTRDDTVFTIQYQLP